MVASLGCDVVVAEVVLAAVVVADSDVGLMFLYHASHHLGVAVVDIEVVQVFVLCVKKG